MSEEIVIRRAETPADYRACQDAQRRAWGITEEGYVIPIATMVSAQLHGGLVLGAFLADGRVAGLSFAFLGRIEGRLGLYSQLTGVVPGYQDRGLGGRMKQFQREWARGKGLGVIAWAFDPLQAGNARFNLDKLGATSGRYLDDMYGPRTDALNAGTPTDRLLVEWPTDPAAHPAPDLSAWHDLPRLIEPGDAPAVRAVPALSRLLIEIPGDINALRDRDAALAARWRLAVRQAFHAAFNAGYRAVGFVREGVGEVRRGYYLLSK